MMRTKIAQARIERRVPPRGTPHRRQSETFLRACLNIFQGFDGPAASDVPMEAMMLKLASSTTVAHAFGSPNWTDAEWSQGLDTDMCCQSFGNPVVKKFWRQGRWAFCCSYHYFECHSTMTVRLRDDEDAILAMLNEPVDLGALQGLQAPADMNEVAGALTPRADADTISRLHAGPVPRSPKSPDAIVVCRRRKVESDDYRLHSASTSFFDMTGYRSEDLIGNNLKRLQGPKTCASEAYAMKLAVHSRKAFESTIVNYAADGTDYTVYIRGIPSHDALEFLAFMSVLTVA